MVLLGTSEEAFEKSCQVGVVCENRGSVWIVKHKPSKTRFVAKIYELEKCQKELTKIQDEILLVRRLHHPNIIKYLASFISGDCLWALMPLVGYTSASRLVHSHFSHGLPEAALSIIAKDVLCGLHYLHSKGIIHRSVKGSHILVDSSGRSLLCGFRHSTDVIQHGRRLRVIHSYPQEAAFNVNWASPELLKQDTEGYSEKTDIYSLGVTLVELGNGEVPYCKFEPQLILVEKIFGREPLLYDANTCKFIYDSGVGESYGDYLANFPHIAEKNFSAAAHNFVSMCLTFDQRSRPSAQTLLDHSFIRQTKKIGVPLPVMLHPVTPILENTDLGENASGVGSRPTVRQAPTSDDFTWIFEDLNSTPEGIQ